jgi:hypothetical protein
MTLSLILHVAFLFLIGVVLFVGVGYVYNTFKFRQFEGIGFIEFFLLGQKRRDRILQLAAEKNVKFLKLLLPAAPGVLATHPDSIKVTRIRNTFYNTLLSVVELFFFAYQFVLSNPQLFPKTQFILFKSLKKLFNNNIVSANGEEWR